MTEEENKIEEGESQYLIFDLDEHRYGTLLLSIREIVECKKVKPVPNTIVSFLGVMNLRGQIIGVIDLRSRFLEAEPSLDGELLVFETEVGPIGALVDKVISVTDISAENIEFRPNIVCSIPIEYLTGIARVGDELITIVDLARVLQSEELISIDESKIETTGT